MNGRKIAAAETERHRLSIKKSRTEKENDWLCDDCGIYCGQRRYFRNLRRCSKCSGKFKREQTKALKTSKV